MQIQNNNPITLNAHKQNEPQDTDENTKTTDESLEKIIQNSAFEVTLSMNAQIILFTLNASDITQGNITAQGALKGGQEIFDFLSGKINEGGLSLSDIGYTGKPITELSSKEASDLINDEGFFGITQTSDRVANFVFSFAGDDLEILEQGRKGIVQGFEEANKLFGGKLPEISYKTQERTLALIDEKINALKN